VLNGLQDLEVTDSAVVVRVDRLRDRSLGGGFDSQRSVSVARDTGPVLAELCSVRVVPGTERDVLVGEVDRPVLLGAEVDDSAGDGLVGLELAVGVGVDQEFERRVRDALVGEVVRIAGDGNGFTLSDSRFLLEFETEVKGVLVGEVIITD